MTGNGERKISSLRDLPLDIAPPRDLWQGIEARIAAEQAASRDEVGAGGRGEGRAGEGRSDGGRSGAARRFGSTQRWQAFAAAAVVAALAVGIWIGRSVLPGAGVHSTGPATANNATPHGTNVTPNDTSPWRAEYVMDPKYVRDRAELVKGLEARLAALPPDSRAKVLASLKAINDSKRDLEAELGKDPSNALLQELLVNTYQDEMRVLTAVHEAGSAGEGI